ncbi:MAG: hypothetical protein KGI35_01660 [Burkholderiales bacterium]|nr:hypothetical protein [Burkholderiales bacterium]MDE2397307.1 hypothetical protein [Burkholderiales bacterium]
MIASTETLSTADLVAPAQAPKSQSALDPSIAVPVDSGSAASAQSEDETLAPLFRLQEGQDFRTTWDAVQIGFVDDPKQAVRKADELVAQVMQTLAKSFSDARIRLEGLVDQADHASTEDLRIALRGYRSFFQRLLSL